MAVKTYDCRVMEEYKDNPDALVKYYWDNFKNPNRNTRNKTKKPKRNPRATLSYYSCQVINGKKENMIFFWGYRTHAIITKEGICLVEKTLPNNIVDAEVAFSLIKELKPLLSGCKHCN